MISYDTHSSYHALVAHCRIWRLLALTFLLAWAGFTLTGVAADPNQVWHDESRSPTEKAVHKRAAAIKERLATTTDPDRIAKLTLMLTKLETLLSKRQQ